VQRNEFSFVASTVDSLIATASSDATGVSQNQALISYRFSHIPQNHSAFMCRSSLYERAGSENQRPADDDEGRQLSAKLHCLFGIPSSHIGRKVLLTHPFARSKIYDLRNYTDKTKWGPFRDDGSMRTDWEMVEGLMIILGYNSGLCCRRFQPKYSPPWTQPLQGVVPERAHIMPEYPKMLLYEPDVPLRLKDPYNVSGEWSRVRFAPKYDLIQLNFVLQIVCFLDYNDLYNFNFSNEAMKVPSDQPREPLTTEEAIRHIKMDIQVTEVIPAGEFDNQSLPVVHFTGRSVSVDVSWDPNANSKIKGTVSLTPEGEVRWQTISVFYG
jgi:hypothetical protein